MASLASQLLSSFSLSAVAAILSAAASVAALAAAYQAKQETKAATAKSDAELAKSNEKIAASNEKIAASNEKIRGLEKDIVLANKEIVVAKRDTELAQAETAKTNLELERVKTHVGARQITEKQSAQIVAALSGHVNGWMFIIDAEFKDYETQTYGSNIRQALEAAGMKQLLGRYNHGALGIMRHGNANPVMIYAPLKPGEHKPNDDDIVYKALTKALGPIFITAAVINEKGEVTTPDYYVIQIASRSAPYFDEK